MDQSSSHSSSEHPRLRPVDPKWVEHEGMRYLYLCDPMGLTDRSVLVPTQLVPLLELCDGTRDVSALQAGLALREGVQLPLGVIGDVLDQLDSALLLENETYRSAARRALGEYRDAEYRTPSLAGRAYAADADALSSTLRGWCDSVPVAGGLSATSDPLLGVVSPHIDYERGHETYAQLWRRAAPGLDGTELVIVFGTDHAGGPGTLTLTRQDYATPFGVLPTDREIVDGLADALGPDRAFGEEIHHIKEHSIELALVWLHHFLGGRACPVVPVLCGSFHQFVTGEAEPEGQESIENALAVLRGMAVGRRTLVVAAADLAHVGPAFADPVSLDAVSRARLAADGAESIAAICDGDAAAFLERSRQEMDSRRLCGLAPIYMALRYLEAVRGESVGYAQCPADEDGGSVVSIVGVLLYGRPD